MSLLKDKIAIVTGASRGIGKAISTRFVEEGASVVTLTKTPNSITYSGVTPVYCDVSDSVAVKEAFLSFSKEFNRLDILVNNAGILADALLGFVTDNLLINTFKTNCFSAFYMSQYASRLMARNQSGSIINIASIMGIEGCKGQSVYSGTKAALVGMTKSLSKELGESNIRVNAIAPGFIDTDMIKNVPEDIREERVNNIALKRVGSPEEVADVAVFLASDLSRYVTGDVIAADGGMIL